MAGKNEVSLTFVGDTVSLERANKRAQDSLAATGKAFDRAADEAVKSSKRIETVAEATDHVDTLGSKATSSLGALSSGFELLGPSGAGAAQGLMTAALATDALSGAGEAATIATDTLRGAVNKAKAAYQGLSTAGKTAVISLGVVAAAAAAAGLVFLAFKQHQQDTKEKIDELSQSLNFQSGALTFNNRQVIANDLEKRGLLDVSNKLGISTADLTDAILAGGDALDKLVPKQVNVNKNSTEQTVLTQKLSIGTHELADQVAKARLQQDRFAVATQTTTKSLADYAKEVRDQFDPMANLVHKLQDVRQRQKDYTDAVKAHGRNSQDARDANLNLAESILAASGAAVDASGKFGGQLTPALHDILRQGGLTEAQIRDIEKSFKDAKKAGDGFAKTYKANAELTIKIKGLTSIHFDSEGNPTRASGRASGGSTNAGGVYKVGESGPELLALGSPGYVANARDTMQIMSGGSRAQGESRVVLEIRSGGSRMDDALVEMLSKAIQTRGGSVSSTFGARP